MRRRSALAAAVAAASAAWMTGSTGAYAQGSPYVNFETIPTRALALSPDGTRLFATNTPDGRLEIFTVGADGSLTAAGSVTVGLEPVAVSARSNDEVWVVNLLSDSVSVVDVKSTPARVVRTLLVGDEPRDIAFAGPDGSRAFITAARRGQNHPDDVVNETQMPGVGRADVWVFDASDLGSELGGKPLSIVTLFADKPGALTVSPDGRTVFVAIATSGNETTAIAVDSTCPTGVDAPPCRLPNGGMAPGGILMPAMSQMGARNPGTGMIVKFNRESGAWLDVQGRDWRDAVPFELPDNDVFAIDAMANPPVESKAIQHVGTLNKSVAVDPRDGTLYVATIEAINTNRFLSVPRLNAFPNPDGAGGAARTADPQSGKTLNGHLYESRITIVQPDGKVVSRHLNKHIDYEVVPSPAGVKEKSVADPQGLALSADGETLFVAALGSNQIVPFKTAELRDDSFQPDAATHIDLSGEGGPTDMVLSADGSVMFVYKRFDNAVATVDIAAKREVASTALFSPEPAEVKNGRKFFYDARLGSSNGEANCNVCHPGADKDDLAWDLGTPFAGTSPNPTSAVATIGQGTPFSPLKGPMTVLTLRGLRDSGPMFWRGDATSPTPNDERANFQTINVVFEALLGRDGPLPDADFAKLTDWVLSLTPFPNPHEPLNRQLNASQAAGKNIFLGGEGPSDGPFACQTCHGLNEAMGFFGTRGEQSVEGETQMFKVTQLRTTYDKVGGFGKTNGGNGDARTLGGPRNDVGPQVRGSGTLHDGSSMSPEEFLSSGVFRLDARQLRQVVDFVFAFPSNLAPVVGQQVTLRADSGADVTARIDLLQQRAAAAFVSPAGPNVRECDLVAKGVIAGQPRGFLFQPQGATFMDDTGKTVSSADLRALAQTPGQELTFTCIYPGGGTRFAIDRDLDGALDGAAGATAAR
jgi:sugar lactone lactonase YvrE/mono/diheme cytochrome c family protein